MGVWTIIRGCLLATAGRDLIRASASIKLGYRLSHRINGGPCDSVKSEKKLLERVELHNPRCIQWPGNDRGTLTGDKCEDLEPGFHLRTNSRDNAQRGNKGGLSENRIHGGR